jgi:hypothetical protein
VKTFITTFLAVLAAFTVVGAWGASAGRMRMKPQDDEALDESLDESLDYYPWLAREMRREGKREQ